MSDNVYINRLMPVGQADPTAFWNDDAAEIDGFSPTISFRPDIMDAGTPMASGDLNSDKYGGP